MPPRYDGKRYQNDINKIFHQSLIFVKIKTYNLQEMQDIFVFILVAPPNLKGILRSIYTLLLLCALSIISGILMKRKDL